MNKKKLHFYTLAIVFTSIITVALMNAWRTSTNENNMTNSHSHSMMGQTMGNMMASMHLKNITLRDLLPVAVASAAAQSKRSATNSPVSQAQLSQSSLSNNATQNHHANDNSSTGAFIPRFVTGTIIVLLPFIVAGAIFLSIVWFGE